MSASDDPTCEDFRGYALAAGELVPTRHLAQWAPDIALWLRSVGYTGSGVEVILGPEGLGALSRHEPAGVAAAVAMAHAQGRSNPLLTALLSTLVVRRPIARTLLAAVTGPAPVDMLVRAGVLRRAMPSSESLAAHDSPAAGGSLAAHDSPAAGDSLAWAVQPHELGVALSSEGTDECAAPLATSPAATVAGSPAQTAGAAPAGGQSRAAGKASPRSDNHHPDSPCQAAADDYLIVAMDLRFHTIDENEYLFFSDCDASMDTHVPGRDHVLGIGAASMSLLTATPRTSVRRVLDLGTGCGIQAVGQWSCAEEIVATDIHPRATDFARANFAAAHALAAPAPRTTVLTTSWFDAVAGQEFDRIISNPPFVVGPARTDHVYRDSGLAMDGATELMVSETPRHLAPGGRAFLMGSWLHTASVPWQQRVASWIAPTGVRAWVLERDHVDPVMYVGTWVRDEGLDPRSSEGIARSREWLSHFNPALRGGAMVDNTQGASTLAEETAAGPAVTPPPAEEPTDDAAPDPVEAIGFGFIVLERLADEAPSEVVCEDFSHPIDHDLGAEFEDYLDRAEWLAQRSVEDLLAHRYLLHPCVALEDVSLARADGEPGFAPAVARVSRTDGPRWAHEVDAFTLTMFKGMHPQGLSARDLIDLALMANGFGDEVDADAVAAAWAPTLVDAIRHGIVLPAEWVDEG